MKQDYTPTLTARDLSIGYRQGKNKVTIASGLNLEMGRGSVTALLGANGAGKSTLLRTLCAQQPQLSGRVEIMGENIFDMPLKQRAQRLSIVYTERTGVGALTVKETVALGRQPYTGFFGLLDSNDRRLVAESISAVGIDHLAEREMGSLSDGERQKAMIARALAQRCPVMVLDEPTSFLDVASRIEVMQLLKRLAEDFETSVLVSTHDIPEALSIADTLWLLTPDKGLIQGSTENLVASGVMDMLFPGRGVVFDMKRRDFVGDQLPD